MPWALPLAGNTNSAVSLFRRMFQRSRNMEISPPPFKDGLLELPPRSSVEYAILCTPSLSCAPSCKKSRWRRAMAERGISRTMFLTYNEVTRKKIRPRVFERLHASSGMGAFALAQRILSTSRRGDPCGHGQRLRQSSSSSSCGNRIPYTARD